MQAIQVKVLGPTNYNGLRIKAWSNSKTQYTEAREYGTDIEEQAKRVVAGFCEKYKWPAYTGFGTLPNGDWVATCGGEV